MKYRNARYTADGRIDCEIDHPVYGWIPFTADENDSEQRGRDIFAQIVLDRNIAAYTPPPEPTIEELRANATLPKDDFILAALDAGVLTEADAEEATNGWPTGWDHFFIGQPDRDRIEAKARWANAPTIARNAPLIEALSAFKGLTPEQVDALFGIA